MTSIFETIKKSRKRHQERLMVEAGFSRLMQVMTGLVPSVETFAIITWENPKGRPPTDEMLYLEFGHYPVEASISRGNGKAKDKPTHRKEMVAAWNNKWQEKLRHALKTYNLAYKQIKGRYGYYENPFFIYNITRKEAISLGKEGTQEPVLFGDILSTWDEEDEEDFPEVQYSLIKSKTGRAVATRTVWCSGSEKEDDMYSEYRGRRFYIPFFDREYADSKFVHHKPGEKPGGVTVEANKLEIMDEYEIFKQEDVPNDIIEEVERMVDERGISSRKTRKHLWYTRGSIFNFLRRSLGMKV